MMLHTSITATTDWTADPRARKLLESCAAHRPCVRFIPAQQRWSAEDTTYTGYRAECLKAIRNEYAARLLTKAYETHDYGPFSDFCASASVDDAIDAALVGGL